MRTTTKSVIISQCVRDSKFVNQTRSMWQHFGLVFLKPSLKTSTDKEYCVWRLYGHSSSVIIVSKLRTSGRVMDQAVSRRSTTAEARVRPHISPFWICGGQSGSGTGFSPSTSVFPCQFYSSRAPLHRKIKTTYQLSLHLHHRFAH
jgi:hypothetical protein